MKILFISHDASRTGAPILLLRLLRVLAKRKDIEIVILLKGGGELARDFAELGETFIWNSLPAKSRPYRYFLRFLKIFNLAYIPSNVVYNKPLLKAINNVDIIFNNTITNAALLKSLPLQGKKIFSYFHEMEVITEFMATKEGVAYLGEISEKIFVPSTAVKDFLVGNYAMPGEKFALLNYVIPTQNADPINPLISNKENKITDNKFLVGFCGTLHWRKGYDLLPLLAKTIVIDKMARDVHFVWIGANKNSIECMILKHDLIKLGLEQYFTFIEPEENIDRYLCQLDVFALPSREDAFPLVVLEAASFAIPTVCFKQAGGILEFIEKDARLYSEYLDIEGMANNLLTLKEDPELRARLGRNAQCKMKQYTDAENIVNQLLVNFNLNS